MTDHQTARLPSPATCGDLCGAPRQTPGQQLQLAQSTWQASICLPHHPRQCQTLLRPATCPKSSQQQPLPHHEAPPVTPLQLRSPVCQPLLPSDPPSQACASEPLIPGHHRHRQKWHGWSNSSTARTRDTSGVSPFWRTSRLHWSLKTTPRAP